MQRFEQTLGRELIHFETGRMAKQADGAVVVSYGGTVVLVAVVANRTAKEGQDFFPLTVDYREMTYAGGNIPGGYFKRESKATEKETLTSRLIDRPIRPLFPEGFFNEVQVTATVLSSDKQNNSDILALNAASAALMISGIPYFGPVAAVRVGEVDGQFVINPTFAEIEKCTLDIIVAITDLGVTMIEAGASELPESRIVEALEFAQKACQPLLKLQKDMKAKAGKEAIEVTLQRPSDELLQKVRDLTAKGVDEANKTQKTKEGRSDALDVLLEKAVSALVVEGGTLTKKQVATVFHEVEGEQVRKFILSGLRTDGRKHDEIRAISCEAGVLPRTHGSALFTRGQTQSLGVVTLGTEKDEQRIDAIEGDILKRFMFHYNFPAYSVGEVKPNRGPGRREIGHGALAERGLRPVIPAKDEFPYTIRVVSDILESNGSSSMASVCSGSLALMDAGVPIKSAVSGIAMGLIKEKDKVAILSDIAGVEDHLGDMDFKVTGTSKGVTAVQLDIKLKDSLDISTLRRALDQAKAGRAHILEKMLATLSHPRKELSAYAPRITQIKIDPDKIREIIGPGGKMIRKITAESGAEINVEDDGTVSIASADEACTKKAIGMIQGITADAEVGRVYEGTVKRIMNFGAFIEILPGKEGLVHISELAEGYVESVDSAVKIGDQFKVKVIEIDAMGRVNLSKKQALIEGPPVVQKRERSGGDRDRGPRGGGGGRPSGGGYRGNRPEGGNRESAPRGSAEPQKQGGGEHRSDNGGQRERGEDDKGTPQKKSWF